MQDFLNEIPMCSHEFYISLKRLLTKSDSMVCFHVTSFSNNSKSFISKMFLFIHSMNKNDKLHCYLCDIYFSKNKKCDFYNTQTSL